MSNIKLTKFANEEQLKISEIVDFLRKNGINKNENTNEVLSVNEIELIRNNFKGFAIRNKGGYDEYRDKFLSNIAEQKNVTDSLELRIIEAADQEKLLIERIIGIVDFDWEFVVSKYSGTISQPMPFTVFDEVICNLLLVQNLSKTDIGFVLGLNPDLDPAGNSIVEKALSSLINDKMIDYDSNIYYLTELGRDYASNGVKFTSFVRDFELYFDLSGRNIERAKDSLSILKSEKKNEKVGRSTIDLNEIQKFAKHQAPEVHFPEKNFILKSADFKNSQKYIAKVWVVFLENFRDSTYRLLVYNEKEDKIVESMSTDLDKRSDLKDKLLKKLLENNEDLKLTDENKTEKQLEDEKALIEKHSELQKALQVDDKVKISKIKEKIKKDKVHYNSVEFEMELKAIFNDDNDELWFISPWLKYGAIKFRYDFFERQLAKGTKVFLVYSDPENGQDVMADPRALKMLQILENKYTNFYIHQLPSFHYKNVWVKNFSSVRKHYTGSFNILSFYVGKTTQKVRQEQMSKFLWDDETEKKYFSFIKSFGEKYINIEIEKYNDLLKNIPSKVDFAFLSKIRLIDNLKLNAFINIGIKTFDEAYDSLQIEKATMLRKLGENVLKDEVEKFNGRLSKVKDGQIKKNEKRRLRQDFEKLKKDFDFLEIISQTELSEINNQINKLKTI